MKRVKTIHWGPRTIDLDILLFGELRMVSEQPTIPHAEMANRRFVLQPLLEVVERISDVTVVKQTQALLDKTADQTGYSHPMTSPTSLNQWLRLESNS